MEHWILSDNPGPRGDVRWQMHARLTANGESGTGDVAPIAVPAITDKVRDERQRDERGQSAFLRFFLREDGFHG